MRRPGEGPSWTRAQDPPPGGHLDDGPAGTVSHAGQNLGREPCARAVKIWREQAGTGPKSGGNSAAHRPKSRHESTRANQATLGRIRLPRSHSTGRRAKACTILAGRAHSSHDIPYASTPLRTCAFVCRRKTKRSSPGKNVHADIGSPRSNRHEDMDETADGANLKRAQTSTNAQGTGGREARCPHVPLPLRFNLLLRATYV
jgi:hypothetical protein